jgi:hypothetical protein
VHEKTTEELRKHYTYHAAQVIQDLDKNGSVVKTETEEQQVEFVDGVQVERVVKKDGKPLTDAEQRKEEDRIQKFVAREKARQAKHQTDDDTISVLHLLELASLTNPRITELNGRSTIVYDYTGNPKAHAQGLAENALKKISGVLWVDEKDLQVARITAHFDENFHIGGGLLANVEKGSEFRFDQALIRNEVWLPTSADATVDARLLLLKGIRQHLHVDYSDYKKYEVDVDLLDTRPVIQNNPPAPATK